MVRTLLKHIGLALVVLGGGMAGSENMLVPFAIILVGALMLLASSGDE